MTLNGIRGGSVQADAIRITRLDALGAPLWGQSSCIQTDNLVKVDFGHDTQAGTDITTVDSQGRACLVWRGRDTMKRSTMTLDICDLDLLIHEMVLGGTLFEDTPTRVTAGDGHTTTASPTVTSVSANFVEFDEGATITGTGIPVGTTILDVIDEHTITLSNNATATAATIVLTITEVPEVVGYQPPHVGEIGCPNGVSVEVWSKRILHDALVGYWHWAFPRNYFSPQPRSLADAAMAMSFAGWGTENVNWGSGPMQDFTQDTTALWQVMVAATLPTPLEDGYQTITSA